MVVETIHNREYKKCAQCGYLVPVENFFKDKARSDGLKSHCKICKNQLTVKYMMICTKCGKIIHSSISNIRRRESTLCKSCESSKRMKQRVGEKNPNWKDDNVGYFKLHTYLRKYNPQPQYCQVCNQRTNNIELANLSGQYIRDINHFAYLCCSCHKTLDQAKRFQLFREILKEIYAEATPNKERIIALLRAMKDVGDDKKDVLERYYKLTKKEVVRSE